MYGFQHGRSRQIFLSKPTSRGYYIYFKSHTRFGTAQAVYVGDNLEISFLVAIALSEWAVACKKATKQGWSLKCPPHPCMFITIIICRRLLIGSTPQVSESTVKWSAVGKPTIYPARINLSPIYSRYGSRFHENDKAVITVAIIFHATCLLVLW